MKLTWLGHSGFRIEMAGQTVLIDPWLYGNPMFPEDSVAQAVSGATHLLLSHGHGDHAGNAERLARDHNLVLVGIYDLITHMTKSGALEGIGFNKGGAITLGDLTITMVNAVHSSSVETDHGPMYAGGEAGFVLEGAGRSLYFSGDTDVHSDMALIQELHTPDTGILCAGGHFTMNMQRAAFAARKFFQFKTVLPCHYRTFPLLEQSADDLKQGLPGVTVLAPEVLETVSL